MTEQKKEPMKQMKSILCVLAMLVLPALFATVGRWFRALFSHLFRP